MSRSKYGFLLSAVLWLVSCGGGTDSGSGGGVLGPTPFTGTWMLGSQISINIGGTSTQVNEVSTVHVGREGTVSVFSTDSSCALSIFVNGSVMTYQTTCVFATTGGDSDGSCVLAMTARAAIQGSPNTATLFGSFGPQTVVCSGAAASYAGNLSGNQPAINDGEDVEMEIAAKPAESGKV